MGSGTKPYTATGIMRLVDQGKIKLDDKASMHIDAPMTRLWATSFAKMFGPRTANVTVRQLVTMRSGLGDMDVPRWDQVMLHSKGVHDPITDLQFLANYTQPLGCWTGDCTWVCEPGTCTAYSSANFILAGLVLLAHGSSPNTTTWLDLDQRSFLGPDFQPRTAYPTTHFPAVGKLSNHGLTTQGHGCGRFGRDLIYSQDASIMGWCYGYALTSPRDAAAFLRHLLGPDNRFVSPESLVVMTNWTALSTGWAAGQLDYGAGLEVRNVEAPPPEVPPTTTALATFIGHDGVTFGFWSNQGWFPQLNASIAVVTDQDCDTTVNYALTCRIVQLVAKAKGVTGGGGLACGSLEAPPSITKSTKSDLKSAYEIQL